MSTTEPEWRYDVYLSFRGDDTRFNFTGNLCNALRQKRFRVFMDDDGLKTGEQISLSLFKALEESRISIVVLSENFASSDFCLHELHSILECRKKKSQLVLPIFYNVDPSDVRHQRGYYGEAMARLEERWIIEDGEKVRKWRSALSEVANTSGWDFRSYRHDYELIQAIVERVTGVLHRYNVYLSFSGKDTRYSFTGYLYNALREQGFETFMKEDGMDDGGQISESLVTAIEKSRLSIIVFSKNYAYSSSCLDELVTILECMKIKNQLVWPIFYKVEPSDIRHQRNSYDKAMTELENKFGEDSEKVREIRSALFEAANLKGWHLKIGYEYELIEKIVQAAIKI